MRPALALLAAAATARAASDAHGCGLNRSLDWVDDANLKARTFQGAPRKVAPPTYVVDLDKEPRERWAEIGAL